MYISELAYLMLPITYHIFIGATDKKIEGKFFWTDGTPFDYSNWSGSMTKNINITLILKSMCFRGSEVSYSFSMCPFSTAIGWW